MTGFPGDKHRVLPLGGKSANRRCGPPCHLDRSRLDDAVLGNYAEWVLRRIWNEKCPSMIMSVAIGGSLNRISHDALPFFAWPSEGRSPRAAPPSVARDSS